MELKATIKKQVWEEGDTEFDPADVNGSDYPEESVEEVNEQYIKGWGVWAWEKDAMWLWRWYGVRTSTRCRWRTSMWQLLFYVSDTSVWFYFKLSDVIVKIVKLAKGAWEWNSKG